jgi:hypothetical protein
MQTNKQTTQTKPKHTGGRPAGGGGSGHGSKEELERRRRRSGKEQREHAVLLFNPSNPE